MKQMRDVQSPRPEAYDRARAALDAAMVEPESTVVRPRRWLSWPKVSVAALGAAAVVTAVVIGTTTGGGVPANEPVAAPPAVDSPLVKLASQVQAAGARTGDASLIIKSVVAKDGSPYTFYTVYTDNGQTFHGEKPSDVTAAVRKGQNQATPFDAKVMEAARLAADPANVDKARIAMMDPLGSKGLGLSPAEQDALWEKGYAEKSRSITEAGGQAPAPKPRPTGKEWENLLSNHLWSNSTYALFIGAANPEVRAGVLNLLATMPEAKVGKGEVDGQATLILTGDASIQGGSGSHVVTIDAGTGLPIRSEVVPGTDKQSVANYRSSRVNLGDVAAGKI
ncbi:hypothetical protein [Lentzea sp. CA-135723]|uniref:hypothetical protein n=1 Tax=Lentzea sp. CA-135723 TaxID=3239950 RepID=UPI003D940FD5